MTRNGHRSPDRSGEPYCTRSQSIEYRNGAGHLIAKVHRSLRPDGTLGGLGKPDPKVLIEGGIRYRALKPESSNG